MNTNFAEWSVILLCLSMASAIGGGLYERIVRTPMWSVSPPSSFAILQPGTGVPLQNFWIPVHAAITVFLLLSLVLTWKEMKVRRWLLLGLGAYPSCASGAVSSSSARCWRFKKWLLTPRHLRNCRRASRAGRFGRGSENRSTSSHSCVFC